jgi:hypothetical protein
MNATAAAIAISFALQGAASAAATAIMISSESAFTTTAQCHSDQITPAMQYLATPQPNWASGSEGW